MTRAFDAVLREPWAIRPEWLHTISEIAAREVDLARVAERHGTDPQALSAKIGGRTEWGTQIRDGVSIIPIGGPIFPRANLMTEFSGATSLDMLAYALEDALQDGDVDAILLDIDSPGGVAAGIGEMAEMIRAGTARKPIAAYVAGHACSAAYWLAAAAGEVVLHPTAMTGSIGVVAGVPVQENADQQGYRLIEIVSSNAPDKRPDPRTDEGAATIRAVLDQLEARFVDDVATYRGVSRDTVLRDFGRGSSLVGAQAVAAGMGDRLGSFEETLAGLAGSEEAATPRPITTERRPAMTGKTVTAASIAADHPEAAEALRMEGHEAGRQEGYADGYKAGMAEGHKQGTTEGAAAGAEAERQRVAALEGVALPGFEALLAAHKADGSKTDTDLLRAQNQAQRAQGETLAAQLEGDEQALASVPAPGATGGQAGSGAKDPTKPPAGVVGEDLETWANEQWQASDSVRSEFKTFGAYHGFLKAAAKRAA